MFDFDKFDLKIPGCEAMDTERVQSLQQPYRV